VNQAPAAPNHPIPRLRTEFFVLFAWTSLIVLVSLRPSLPHDLWWHLRVGQWILEEGRVPTTNRFAWSIPVDAPYVYGAWLGDVLLYALHRLGGVELLVGVRNLLAGGLLALVALEARRRNHSWRFAGFAVLGAGVLMFNNLSLRPQMFAWVPFGLVLVLLGRYVDGRLGTGWLVGLLAGLMAFWVNVHGSFVLGFALVGAYLAGELLAQWRGPGPPGAGARVRGLALALGAMGLASLANPQGPGIYRYVGELLTDVPSQQLVVEWQPPTPHGTLNVVFFASVLVLLVVWAQLRQPPPLRDLLLVAGFLWLAWRGMRYVLWYGVVAAPILVEGLTRLRGPQTGPVPVGFVRKDWLLVCSALVLVVVLPWLGRGPAPVTDTPVAAAEYLRDQPGGRLFNEMVYGSYLIWALPEARVFVDPRVDMYPLSIWEDYIAISQGRDALALLDQYGADRVMLGRNTQARLAEALDRSGVWQREYADADAEVWRRVPGASPGQAGEAPARTMQAG
jgi:hypothetical protein